MNQKSTRVLGIGILLSAAFFAYTNCAPPNLFQASGENHEASSTLDSETPTSGLEKIDVSGGTIMRDIGTGCTPRPLADFLEAENPLVKRIEPHNCALLKINTPVISWFQPADYKPGSSYTLHIWAESPATNHFDGSYYPTLPRFLMPRTLPAGIYAWSISYAKSTGGTGSGLPRRFVIPDAAFSIPTGATFAAAVQAKAHPRVQPTEPGQPNVRISFPEIVKRAQDRGYKPIIDNYLSYAANTSLSSSVTLPSPLLTRNQSLDIRRYLENMAYAYRFTGNLNYVNKGIEWLKAISKWPIAPVSVDPGVEDQVNRELLLILGVGMDLYSDILAKTEYDGVRNLMVAAFKARMAEMDFNSFNRYPYDSHLLTCAQYALEAMMYAAGTKGLFATPADENKELVRLWENAMTTSGTWGGYEDAGWANAVGYGWYAADIAARMMATVKVMAGIDLTKWHVLSKFGDNELYMSAPLLSIRQAFGDESNQTNHYSDYSRDTSRMLAMMTGNPAYEWYWRQRPVDATYPHVYNPIHFMVVAGLSSAPVAPSSTPALPASILFEDAGIAAFHSRTTDPLRTSVYFRSSRFGSFNHSHADQNAFTFISKGKDLLVSGGYYDQFGTTFHSTVTRATRYKNALTFDGGVGQAELQDGVAGPGVAVQSMQATGRIVNFADDGNWAVVTGDATKAYGEFDKFGNPMKSYLKAAYRSVVYNRSAKVVVIYDRASSDDLHQWELNFQALKLTGSPTASGKTMTILNSPASACIQIYGPIGAFSYPAPWNNMRPNNGMAPDQVHSRYTVATKTKEFAAITVIKEDCPQADPVYSMSFGGTNGMQATINIKGSLLIFNDLQVKTP